MNKLKKQIYHSVKSICTWIFYSLESLVIIPLVILAVFFRFRKKSIDIGLGPEPLINNIYHKRALEIQGYTAETFVNDTYFITDNFDIRADKISNNIKILRVFIPYYLTLKILSSYKCIYIYFNGGPLANRPLLKKLEPYIFALANIKVVVMPYGADIHDLTLSRNLEFKHALSLDYPLFQKAKNNIISQNIKRWTKHADHIISGCDWVYYNYHWDTLTLAHFSIDVDKVKLSTDYTIPKNRPVKIFHCPNHKNIKGSQFFINAVSELQNEGYSVELTIVQNQPNDIIRQQMQEADIIADQLVIGWYAMTALEGMCYEKPVLCYLDPKLISLYQFAGLIEPGEIPLVNCNHIDVKNAIKNLLDNPQKIKEIGKKGREYVIKHHSTEAIGAIFDKINKEIGLIPSKHIANESNSINLINRDKRLSNNNDIAA